MRKSSTASRRSFSCTRAKTVSAMPGSMPMASAKAVAPDAYWARDFSASSPSFLVVSDLKMCAPP